jgi:hypothetical protein
MNWDAIGAIAELLGAVGVIASLIYLATQIRQSREQMRAATAQQLQSQLTSTGQAATRDPELARLLRRGNENVEQLDEDELFRFNFYFSGLWTEYDTAYYQYRIGLLDEDRWQVIRCQLKFMLQPPGITRWWANSQMGAGGLVSPEFVALVSEILGEEPEV